MIENKKKLKKKQLNRDHNLLKVLLDLGLIIILVWKDYTSSKNFAVKKGDGNKATESFHKVFWWIELLVLTPLQVTWVAVVEIQAL